MSQKGTFFPFLRVIRKGENRPTPEVHSTKRLDFRLVRFQLIAVGRCLQQTRNSVSICSADLGRYFS